MMSSKARNFVVLDLETQRSFKEVGKSKLDKLKISVVGIFDYRTETYTAYEEDKIIDLEKRLQNVDLLIGFNIRRFDLPVLAPYLFMDVGSLPVLDLLDDIEKERKHRASLESIAQPSLNQRKSGTGADALVLFKQKKMEELKRYCLDDVRLTKEIYEFGCREGKVFFTSSWDYQTYEVPVRWKEATEEILKEASSRDTNFPTSLF